MMHSLPCCMCTTLLSLEDKKKALESDNGEETVINPRFLVFERRKITMDNAVITMKESPSVV